MAATVMTLSWTRRIWWWLRQVSGDAAYDNYLRHCGSENLICTGAACSGAKTFHTRVSPKQFYLERLERKYARISRCC